MQERDYFNFWNKIVKKAAFTHAKITRFSLNLLDRRKQRFAENSGEVSILELKLLVSLD